MHTNFSVLMSIHGGENVLFLEQCLKSLSNQSLKATEVVLVEDGIIPPNLKTIIEKYRTDLNIKSVILEKNRGLSVALNAGLDYCKYNLIARMDGDDISLPDRFETQIKIFSDIGSLDVLGSYAQEIDSDSKKGPIRKMPLSHSEIYSCLYAIPFVHPSVMFKKSSIKRLGGYDKRLRRRQDYDLWFRAGAAGMRFQNIPKVLVLYRFDKDTHGKQSRYLLFYQGIIGLKGVCKLRQPIWKGLVAFMPFFRGLLPLALQHKVYRYLKKIDPREHSNDKI